MNVICFIWSQLISLYRWTCAVTCFAGFIRNSSVFRSVDSHFTFWAKHGGHSSGFSRGILFLTFWLAEAALSTKTRHLYTEIWQQNNAMQWYKAMQCRTTPCQKQYVIQNHRSTVRELDNFTVTAQCGAKPHKYFNATKYSITVQYRKKIGRSFGEKMQVNGSEGRNNLGRNPWQ